MVEAQLDPACLHLDRPRGPRLRARHVAAAMPACGDARERNTAFR